MSILNANKSRKIRFYVKILEFQDQKRIFEVNEVLKHSQK
jgi:hypothetical protein